MNNTDWQKLLYGVRLKLSTAKAPTNLQLWLDPSAPNPPTASPSLFTPKDCRWLRSVFISPDAAGEGPVRPG